eukprot:gene8673-28577_t
MAMAGGWNWLREGNKAALKAAGNDSSAGPAVMVVPRIPRGSSSWWRGDGKDIVPVPAVLLDENMPSQLTAAYLAANYGDKVVPLDINSPQQNLVKLGDFLQFQEEDTRNKQYLRNLHIPRWFPEEAASMSTPAVLGVNLLADPARTPRCPPEWRNWCELFVSTKECKGFPVLHTDVCHIHAFSMQIQGTKRFTIFAPSDSPYLYTQAPSHTSSQLPTDLDDVDFEEYPLYAKATPIYVDLQPGETLFMPAGWWHTARATSGSNNPSVTVAGSLVGEDNIEEFLCQHADFLAAQSLISVGALAMH